MRYALILMAFAVAFNGCEASAPGSSGQGYSSQSADTQSAADVGSSSDSNTQEADQPAVACVDPTVNGQYVCDGVEETAIVAVLEECGYQSAFWFAKAEDTQVLPDRVITKTGKYTNDCVRKKEAK